MIFGYKSDFHDGVGRHLEFRKFRFLSRDYHRVHYLLYSVPNFIKIGQLLTEIWRFKCFQNGGRPPSWILKLCIFCYVTWPLSACRSAFQCKISLKSHKWLISYGKKRDFHDVMQPLSTCRSASSYFKISLKSDNRLMDYGQKSDFQDGGRRHLEFQKFKFLVT